MTNDLYKWISAAVVILFGWFVDMPAVVRLLLLVMALDVVAGIAAAVVNKKLSSQAAREGVARKATALVVVALSYAIANHFIATTAAAPVGQTVAAFYVVSESVSILEKAKMIGLPLPEFLHSALENINTQKLKKQKV